MRFERITAEDYLELGGARGAALRLRGLVPDGAAVASEVAAIIDAVRADGDAAVLRYTRELDTHGAEPKPLRVPSQELNEALETLPLELVGGLQAAIMNVAQVAEAGVSADADLTLAQGQRILLREVPVDSAAVYVPGGRAPYPSTVVMGVVTARTAGVIDVCVCTPPGPSGQIDPVILGACRLVGVERVYRMGGAQAIAALAFGTDSVPAVDVVVGPGNLYVQEAKHQLARQIGIDGFAGPSDLLVLLAGSIDERDLALCALDMLAQGEHGAGSLVVAASPSQVVCNALAQQLERLVLQRPSVGEADFAVVTVPDALAGVALANAFAPEHLQLIGAEFEHEAKSVHSAGCVFVGANSGTAFGDYVAGSNHVLPTSGAARFASGLAPRHFRRRMAEVTIGDAAAAEKLAAAGAPIARAEGFDVHAESMEARVGENWRT